MHTKMYCSIYSSKVQSISHAALVKKPENQLYIEMKFTFRKNKNLLLQLIFKQSFSNFLIFVDIFLKALDLGYQTNSTYAEKIRILCEKMNHWLVAINFV